MIIRGFNTDEKVLIVAEIGNNHEGDFEVAKELLQKAAECGVDAVKFQTFRTEHYVSKKDEARFNRLKSFELSKAQFEELSKMAQSLGLLFISTPFDLHSAAFLEKIVDAYKIASGDNNFYPLIEKVARTGKPLIISTGMSDEKQVTRTISFVKNLWREYNRSGQLAILHCVSAYPVASDQVNLRSIQYFNKMFDCTVGYSDHTLGIEAAVVAVALGARIIEKHFTIDKNFSDFRDHQLSADPTEMRELVRRIKSASLILGTEEKTIQPDEQAAIGAMRRSIVAGKDMARGYRLSFGDLTWIRPGGGLAPGEEHKLIGKVLKREIAFGDQILLEDVDG